MKKGYTVILILNYRTTIEIETEEEDEEKIMETAATDFVDSMRGTNDIEDIFGDMQAVGIERNGSELSDFEKWREEERKTYEWSLT